MVDCTGPTACACGTRLTLLELVWWVRVAHCAWLLFVSFAYFTESAGCEVSGPQPAILLAYAFHAWRIGADNRAGMNETVGQRTYAPPPQPFLAGTRANRVDASETTGPRTKAGGCQSRRYGERLFRSIAVLGAAPLPVLQGWPPRLCAQALPQTGTWTMTR